MSSRFKKKIINLDTSHSEDMKRLSDIFTDYEVKKGGLKEELNSRLEAQEEKFKNERLSLSSLVIESNEQKLEAERKLKEVEEKSRLEKEELMKDIEDKIAHIIEKEKELRETKSSIEDLYQAERRKLEER